MTSSTRETAYHEALGPLYDTALDSGAWAQFMTRFAGAVGACGAQYLVWSDATNAMGYTSVIGAFAPDAAQRYGDYYGTIDPRRELLYAKGDAGWLQCHEHFDNDFVSRSEFYNDFLIPVGARSWNPGVPAAARPGAVRPRRARVLRTRRGPCRAGQPHLLEDAADVGSGRHGRAFARCAGARGDDCRQPWRGAISERRRRPMAGRQTRRGPRGWAPARQWIDTFTQWSALHWPAWS